ncbi:hypothetical protein GCM10007938_42190 [Vibrio zhanjiangensis]|uniref:Uncharacterized protein n=1 Tax=Vibrio zhanjiangensis TaxID=1046128 RepID=A0ABQ6F642_9VIBR|nr:hypothetical protein [Vibrio zhanjiangensis]GLT20434.1 hypothetical protein GCM10007938_42190 [Vibrio zhanjiangensis]
MSYQFKYTEENGYQQVKVSKKDHNATFKYRQIKWSQRYEYYLNEERGHFVMIRLTSLPAKLVSILCYPVIVLLHGLVNYKEINQEISDQWYEKVRGRFVADDCYRNQKGWDELMGIVKKC